jgi:O-6-methylguanine DNA methyltransferase
MTYYAFTDTPAGTLLLIGDGKVVNGIHWKVFKRTPKIKADWIEDSAVFKKAIKQLDEYFKGKRKEFDFDVAVNGTDFQKRVWKELSKISHGSHKSYKEIAKALRKPGAVRAVGTAVGSNPLSIVVPCHRVLTASGKLGGFAGGLSSKKTLLAVENIIFCA